MALNEESQFFSLLLPHFGVKIWCWIHNLVFPLINIEIGLFHLDAKLSHHNGWLSLVLIGLYHSFILLSMVISRLISLGESMVIHLSTFIASESSNIGFHLTLLLNFYSHYFNLIENKVFKLFTWLSASLISTSNILGMTNSSVSIESK